MRPGLFLTVFRLALDFRTIRGYTFHLYTIQSLIRVPCIADIFCFFSISHTFSDHSRAMWCIRTTALRRCSTIYSPRAARACTWSWTRRARYVGRCMLIHIYRQYTEGSMTIYYIDTSMHITTNRSPYVFHISSGRTISKRP